MDLKPDLFAGYEREQAEFDARRREGKKVA